MNSPLNPLVALAVTYEYLICLLSSDRLRPPARRKAWGLLSEPSTPGTTGPQLWPKIRDMTGSL
jgi:hypothetical protein